MQAKNIFGFIILVLNIAGMGYVFYMVASSLIARFFPKEDPQAEHASEARPKQEEVIIDEDIIPDDEDLLKDMDLSDLDNLNLDDFE